MNFSTTRYNPEIISTLEEYVVFQTEAGYYDFEANLSLLKIYQFRPSTVNKDASVQLLLKALTQLPSTDFVTLKCVLPQALVSEWKWLEREREMVNILCQLF